ncbi:MAG TPA: hypothetical protein PKE47_09045 [Verrucomicrobiota bacterium]|nr:hypothetical protein [Verrucomicrobiota bacterium]
MLAAGVKNRMLTLADLEGTLLKSRKRGIKDIFFCAPETKPEDEPAAVHERTPQAFSAGQNLYRFEFFELARTVLALGGEPIRQTFLRKVGEHLDAWKTQPVHLQAWKQLLESL